MGQRVVVALIVLAGAAASVAGPTGESAVAREDLLEVRALVDGLEKKPASARADVVRQLVARGEAGAACVLELRTDFHTPAHVDVFSEALRRLRHPQFEPYLLSVIASAGELAEKRVAFDRCAQYGSRAIVIPFARTMAANEGREKILAERAFVKILGRHGDAKLFRALDGVLRSLDEETRARVLASIASSGSPHALALLGGALGREAKMDLVVLTGISRVPTSAYDDAVARRVKGYLAAPDVSLRREAALILGRWRDHRAVGPIIEMLHDEDPSVLKNAQWALAKISGLGYPPTYERWSRWYEGELAWWGDAGGAYLETATTAESDADAYAALLEIGKHNYAPAELGPALFGLADDENADVAKLARMLIGRFGLRPVARD